ncbi:MAG: glycine betaine ABC transporter substrate-binding protein [Candidatus Competibacterales bacterium]
MTLLRTLAAVLAFGAATVASADSIVVGGKNFTEQQLLAEMTTQLLRAKGFEVDKRAGMGSAVLRAAQENGQIDLYWEYTGTSLINYNDVKERMSPEETYQTVKEMDAEKGLTWLAPSEANNTYAFAMQRGQAEEMGIDTLSDLAAAVNDDKDLVFASNAEFYARDDGLRPLQQAYGFRFPRANIKRMDSGLTYQALKEDQVDVALVFATDGRIKAFDFKVLKDDKNFFPAYAITPVVRQATLEEHPELADLLNQLSAELDDETMAALNAQVDVEKTSIEAVAENFLQEQGLI